MGKKVILLLFLLFIPLLSAVPPATIIFNGEEGYELESPVLSYAKIGEPIHIVVHVFNKSDGALLDITDGVFCEAILLDLDGSELIVLNATAHLDHYDLDIDGNNITKRGIYGFTIHCLSDDFGGFLTSYFEASYSGKELSTSNSVMYIPLFLVFFFLFFITFYGIGLLPSKNETDPDNRIIKISYLKYLRTTLYFVLWMFVIAILYISSNLAFAYLPDTLIANFLFTFFKICFGLTLPITIIIFLWILSQITEDKQLNSMMKRGLFNQNF